MFSVRLTTTIPPVRHVGLLLNGCWTRIPLRYTLHLTSKVRVTHQDWGLAIVFHYSSPLDSYPNIWCFRSLVTFPSSTLISSSNGESEVSGVLLLLFRRVAVISSLQSSVDRSAILHFFSVVPVVPVVSTPVLHSSVTIRRQSYVLPVKSSLYSTFDNLLAAFRTRHSLSVIDRWKTTKKLISIEQSEFESVASYHVSAQRSRSRLDQKWQKDDWVWWEMKYE